MLRESNGNQDQNICESSTDEDSFFMMQVADLERIGESSMEVSSEHGVVSDMHQSPPAVSTSQSSPSDESTGKEKKVKRPDQPFYFLKLQSKKVTPKDEYPLVPSPKKTLEVESTPTNLPAAQAHESSTASSAGM
ncbi:hypothetical protein COOONC_00683 [Cooperia oncophora]